MLTEWRESTLPKQEATRRGQEEMLLQDPGEDRVALGDALL